MKKFLTTVVCTTLILSNVFNNNVKEVYGYSNADVTVEDLAENLENLTNAVNNLTNQVKYNTPNTGTRIERHGILYNDMYDKYNLLVKNGVTYVSLRNVANVLGLDINYNNETSKVTIEKNGIKLAIKPNATLYTLNGNTKSMKSPAYIKDGTTLVPLRFIAETFRMSVGYDATSEDIIIKNKPIENYLNISEDEQKYYVARQTGYGEDTLYNYTEDYIYSYGNIIGEHVKVFKYTDVQKDDLYSNIEYIVTLSKDGTVTQKTIIGDYTELQGYKY